MMFLSEKIRRLENFHIFLWLLKDMCWVMNFKTVGVVMILPTFGLAAYLTWHARVDFKEFLFNTAVLFWISANGIWMIGEFFYNDGLRPQALVLFCLGILSISLYYTSSMLRKKKKVN